MRLSWNEVRARASVFAGEWKDAAYERGETQSFYNDFFGIFGVRRRSVARYEQHVKKLGRATGFIDLFWPGVLIVEQKSAGRDLGAAFEQAGEYFDALSERDRPRYILVSDFRTFELHDLAERSSASFALSELPDRVELFGFILGVERRVFRDQDPANIEAAELVGRIHDALLDAGYAGHDLERFLVRIVFCLFADDTGIFEPRDIFLELLEERTGEDGADLGLWLAQLFQVLDTPEDRRQSTLDQDLARFPYVDGALFEGSLRIPSFDAEMRRSLLAACRFDWSNISPAIFGALFQSVMDPRERRAEGAHYTTEKNILKVIEPLFMDGLRAEFERLKSRRDSRRLAELRRFQAKLGKLTFLDPACGCGNFLIIAYRELRLLEIEAIREIRDHQAAAGQAVLDVRWTSAVDVDQFFGIELSEFPARIAETALWMMDHIMNNRLSMELGQSFARIPLKKSPRIAHADALEIEWTELLPPEECSYVLGNPPFSGFVMRSAVKRAQAKALMRELGASGSRLDYVAAWLLKAGAYFSGKTARIAFVATNSIVQGEQVAQLWPALFNKYGLELTFAHRTFAWGSDARGKAHVHVVIVGLADHATAPSGRRIFVHDGASGESSEINPQRIGPYLQDASKQENAHLVVSRQRESISGFPKIRVGTKPVDGGRYIFKNKTDVDRFLDLEPLAAPFVCPFVGSREYINGLRRWILCVTGVSPQLLRSMPYVLKRVRSVRAFREAGGRLARSLANQPTAFHVTVLPKSDYLVIPETSSERREYVPVGYLRPPTIPSNALLVVEDATLGLFALLTSTMHMTWLRQVGGRLESRYRYSSGLVYNTFPLPEKSLNPSKLEPLAQAVLDARAAHPESALADLYDPDLMPPRLRRAHQALDRAVDRLYRLKKFSSEQERVERLFELYEKMRTPLVRPEFRKKRRRRRAR